MNRRLTLLLANLPGIAANFSSCQREMNIAKRGARSATDADNPSIIEELVVSFIRSLSEKIREGFLLLRVSHYKIYERNPFIENIVYLSISIS